MARPVNADSNATRRRILESATLLFSEQGDRSSVRDIAKGADVSLAMVHHYFGSKDDLYSACVDAMYEKLAELRGHLLGAVDPDVADGERVESVLEQSVRAVFRFARGHLPTVRLLMRSVVTRGALDVERREEFLLPFLDQVSHLIASRSGRRAEELRLPLQSLVFLHGRYAIADAGELMLVTGTSTSADAVRAVEDHLVATARRLLFDS